MLTQLLTQPGFWPGLGIGALLGALVIFLMVTAFDALEDRALARGTRPKRAKAPRAVPTNRWGPGPHGRSARADMRSAPR